MSITHTFVPMRVKSSLLKLRNFQNNNSFPIFYDDGSSAPAAIVHSIVGSWQVGLAGC